MNSPLDIEVSCFVNAKSTEPRPVNLLTWLTSDKYKLQVETIRQTNDKEAKTALKQRLPAITPSGIFLKRNIEGLIKHSGILCIDIDYQDNTHIGNYSDLKRHLCNIQNFAFVGLSVSGNGFYCMVPISEPENHKLHFRAMQDDLKRFGVIVDKSGSDVSRLRFYSYDHEAYFNHEAKVYTKILHEVKPKPQPLKSRITTTQKDVIEPLDIIVNMVRGSRDGEKHFVLYRAARLAGGYISGNQLDETTAINALEDAIQAKSNVNSLEDAYKTIRDGVEIGKGAPIVKQAESVNNVNSVESVNVSNVQNVVIPEPKAQEPLKPATGKLLELENIFIQDKPKVDIFRIVKLFDLYKREPPTPGQLEELENLLYKEKTSSSQEATRGLMFTDIQR